METLRRRLLELQRIEVPDGVLLTRTHCQFPATRAGAHGFAALLVRVHSRRM